MVVGALLLFTARQRARRLERFTAQAAAIVTSVDFTDYRTGSVGRDRTDTVVDARAGKRRRTTHIMYRYTVAGRDIENQLLQRGDKRADYAAGMRMKACYDPRFPEESVLVAPEAKCGR